MGTQIGFTNHVSLVCCFQQVSHMHSHMLSCRFLICLRLNLSNDHNFSFLSDHGITPSFSYPKQPCPTFSLQYCHNKFSCLTTCPSHLCFLFQIIFNMLLASLACTNASLFVTFSVQLIFSILCHVYISNASYSFTCFQLILESYIPNCALYDLLLLLAVQFLC